MSRVELQPWSRRKKLLWVGTIFGGLLAIYASVAFSDIDPVDVSDLIWEYPEVPDEENAYVWLKRAREAEKADNTEREVELTLRAAECSQFAPPDERSLVGFGFGISSALREAKREGDPDTAWRIFSAIRWLTYLQTLQPTGFTTASAFRHSSHASIEMFELVAQGQSPEELRRSLKGWDSPVVPRDWASRGYRRRFTDLRRGLLDPESRSWLVRPQRTIAFAAELTRERIRQVEEDRFEPLEFEWGLGKRILRALGGNSRGEYSAELFTGSWEFELVSVRGLILRDQLLRTAIALRIWKLERGAYPETLDQLVPDLLPAVPTDSYDPNGEPFRWDRTRRVLWSVGSNGVDDGASPTPGLEFGTAASRGGKAPLDLTVVFPKN